MKNILRIKWVRWILVGILCVSSFVLIDYHAGYTEKSQATVLNIAEQAQSIPFRGEQVKYVASVKINGNNAIIKANTTYEEFMMFSRTLGFTTYQDGEILNNIKSAQFLVSHVGAISGYRYSRNLEWRTY
ncbi:MAG: hypothetical protein LAO31_05550 [Acidobacteriia bacterium]|nr:hypothetical protein [Terriglobia bacterium]